jgi:hypothetical protein
MTRDGADQREIPQLLMSDNPRYSANRIAVMRLRPEARTPAKIAFGAFVVAFVVTAAFLQLPDVAPPAISLDSRLLWRLQCAVITGTVAGTMAFVLAISFRGLLIFEVFERRRSRGSGR